VNIDELITVEPHNPAWVAQFAGESAVLSHTLSIEPSRIEHIGSTDVLGMHAKPIVDIMLGLDSFPAPTAVPAKLCSLGYKASSRDHLIREELCQEAIRLGSLLAEHPIGNQPRTHALVALMLLNAARLPARTDSEGNILRLKEQDRSTWNQALIARGMRHLSMSAAGDELSAYHLQAGIAACHCAASDYESTDWPQILSLYDQLLELDDSPVIALNRAVAVANVHGPQAGIAAVETIENGSQLNSYYLLYAVLGEFEKQLNNFQAAIDNFRKALELTELTSEQLFLSKRLQDSEERRLRIVA
jgi:predicted RNA polymerase sigma factor